MQNYTKTLFKSQRGHLFFWISPRGEISRRVCPRVGFPPATSRYIGSAKIIPLVCLNGVKKKRWGVGLSWPKRLQKDNKLEYIIIIVLNIKFPNKASDIYILPWRDQILVYHSDHAQDFWATGRNSKFSRQQFRSNSLFKRRHPTRSKQSNHDAHQCTSMVVNAQPVHHGWRSLNISLYLTSTQKTPPCERALHSFCTINPPPLLSVLRSFSIILSRIQYS
jgi:hypothetical protein